MIPRNFEPGTVARERLPAWTFRLDGDVVRGMTDGHEAVKQAVRLILHTERYRYVIYSFAYGVELQDLAGSRDSFLFPEVKRRVTEALLVDDRVLGTSDFTFLRTGTRVEVRFVVHTVYGDMEMEWEV